jgi:hypothetical protein
VRRVPISRRRTRGGDGGWGGWIFGVGELRGDVLTEVGEQEAMNAKNFAFLLKDFSNKLESQMQETVCD